MSWAGPDARATDAVTVGCVNFSPVWGDKVATVDKLEATIVEAGAQGIDILVFPERAIDLDAPCDDCRSLQRACPAHLALAETVPGPTTERVARLASEHGMYVVFGLSERESPESTVLYNSAAVVAPHGVLGTYRKLFLGSLPWSTEGLVFSPGTELPVWATPWGPMGVLICFDFWLHPELVRILALKGAGLIINSSATHEGPAKDEFFAEITKVRAAENLVYVASANFVAGPGRADSYGATELDAQMEASFCGGSMIAGPAFPRFSQVYTQAGKTEELVAATLSMRRLDRWQQVYPWRKWHIGHQQTTSKLIAAEMVELADRGTAGAS